MDRLITPIVHPASVMRGRPVLAGVQVAYLRRLASDPGAAAIDVSRPPPSCNPAPSLQELSVFAALVRHYDEWVVLDVENAGPVLICCGLVRLHPSTLAPERGVCFRFTHQGGAPWEDTDQRREILAAILGDSRVGKVTHFGIQHDFPLLIHNGFTIAGPLVDTSVLCHAVHSEAPKGLQFLATAFCGAPRWKDIPDEKEATDADSPEPADE